MLIFYAYIARQFAKPLKFVRKEVPENSGNNQHYASADQ
jgi:hypothetical protein